MLPEEVTDWNKQWKDVRFEDKVRIVGVSRRRSAANFLAESVIHKKRYTIFMSDLLDMLSNDCIYESVIGGTFKVNKKNKSFGVCLVDVEKRQPTTSTGVHTYPIPDYI